MRRPLVSREILNEVKPIAVLSAAEGGARLLSFAFYLVAARALLPADFGIVRYTITLSVVACVAVDVLVKALMKELGGVRGDRERVREVLGTGLAASVVVLLVSTTLTVVAVQLGLTSPAQTLGLLAVTAGTACFQLYYAMGRGIGQMSRPVVTYVGASACQLLAFGLAVGFSNPSVTTTLLIYGGSGVVPLLVWEAYRPLLLHNTLRPSRDAAHVLWRIAVPLILGQVAYIVWNSTDQIWVASTLGATQIGWYAAAKNVAQVLVILPLGSIGALLPRMAELRAAGQISDALSLLYRATFGVLAVSAVIAVSLILFRTQLLQLLYGTAYLSAAAPFAALAVAMVIYAGQFTLTGSAIGLGLPSISAITLCIAATVEVAVFILFPGTSGTFAAWTYAGSIGVAFVIAIALMAYTDRRLRALP